MVSANPDAVDDWGFSDWGLGRILDVDELDDGSGTGSLPTEVVRHRVLAQHWSRARRVAGGCHRERDPVTRRLRFSRPRASGARSPDNTDPYSQGLKKSPSAQSTQASVATSTTVLQ